MLRRILIALILIAAASEFLPLGDVDAQRRIFRPRRRPAAGAAGCTITAAANSPAAATTALTGATASDVVCLPVGTSATWTTGIAINGVALTFDCQGSTIVEDLPDNAYVIDVTESTTNGDSVEVKNCTFDSRTTTHQSGSTGAHININGVTNGHAVLLHGNTHLFGDGCSGNSGINAMFSDVNRGVIYSNTITAATPSASCGYLNQFAMLRVKVTDGTPALDAWAAASTMGDADTTGEMNLYFESNTVTNMLEGTDFDDSSRVVFRYNTLMDTMVRSHGRDSSTHGTRQVDMYGNSIDYGENLQGGVPANVVTLVELRGGGVWYIHDNAIADPSTTSPSIWGAKDSIFMQLYALKEAAYCYNDSYPMPHQHGRGHNGTSEISDPVRIWGNTQLATPWVAAADPLPSSQIGVHASDPCRADKQTTADFVQENRDYYLSAPASHTDYTYPHPLRR